MSAGVSPLALCLPLSVYCLSSIFKLFECFLLLLFCWFSFKTNSLAKTSTTMNLMDACVVLLTLTSRGNTNNQQCNGIKLPAITYSPEFLLSCRGNANTFGADITVPRGAMRVETKRWKVKIFQKLLYHIIYTVL